MGQFLNYEDMQQSAREYAEGIKAEIAADRRDVASANTKKHLVELALKNVHPNFDPVDIAERAFAFITSELKD